MRAAFSLSTNPYKMPVRYWPQCWCWGHMNVLFGVYILGKENELSKEKREAGAPGGSVG